VDIKYANRTELNIVLTDCSLRLFGHIVCGASDEDHTNYAVAARLWKLGACVGDTAEPCKSG